MVRPPLQAHGPASSWDSDDYDLALAAHPEQLDHWVGAHIRNGTTARITAGFCWPWDSPPTPPLVPEVVIPYDGPNGPRTWARP